MKHIIKVISFLSIIFSFLPCYSQERKTNYLNYLSTFEYSKCIIHNDSANKVNYFLNPDSLPQFPGGLEEMEKYIIDNAKFDFNSDIDAVGKIIFEFIVNEKGEVLQIKILRGLFDIYDNELFRVLKKMPSWKPAICDKKKVPVKMKFSFKIELR